MKLEVSGLSFAYGSTPVLRDVDMMADTLLTAVIGPNGAGKSTLMACIAGFRKAEGKISLDGVDARDIDPDELSRSLSFLPQEPPSRAVMTVFEAVLLGRLHTLRWRVMKEDLDVAYSALCELGIEDLAARNLNELSGGQRQLVSIAQALAKEPGLLLMDEPTNSLDLQHQLELFDMIRRISVEKEIRSVIVIHDLNLAARYADHIVVLKDGRVSAAGPPEKVLTGEMIRSVYGVHAEVYSNDDGTVHVHPICSVRGSPDRQNEVKRR